MASGSISSAFSERSSGPYGKPIKCKVVAACEPVAYRRKDGASKKAMTVAVSDGQEVIKVGQTIVVRETIRRTENDGKVLVVTTVTKVFMSAPLDVPDDHYRRALLLVNPPPADKVTVKEALRSPAKKKITVACRTVQMCDAPAEQKVVTVEGVSVSNNKTELFLQDESVIVVLSELLHAALATTDIPHVDLEMATAEGPLKLE